MAGTPHPCVVMRNAPLFKELWTVLEREVVPGKERPALSHHTTMSCRPKESRAEAPLTSLSAAGLDDDVPAGRPGEVVVRIRGQNLIRNGDNLGAGYESPPCRSGKEARSVAALEFMCILLGVASDEIRLPPSASNGAASPWRSSGKQRSESWRSGAPCPAAKSTLGNGW